MKRLTALLLAFSLLSCPVSADAEESECEHFRAWAEWNEEIATESLGSEVHRTTAVCPDCGTAVSIDEPHDFSYAPDTEAYDGKQHRTLKTCAVCGFAAYEYADHVWQYGEWQTEDESLYYRSAVCSVCGMENHVLDFYETGQAEDSNPVLAENVAEPEAWQEENEVQETEDPEQAWPKPWQELPIATEGTEPVSLDIAETESVYPVAVISVTVPDNMPLTVTGDGYVYAIDNLGIVNHSDGAVKVTGITVAAAGDWHLMPYTGSNAVGEAEVKSIGIAVNGAFTTGWGSSEVLYLPGDWTIAKNAVLPLHYDASVSFRDIPHEGEQVLSLTFVLDWA